MPQPWTIRREVDLARDFVGVERIAALATTSAKAAHELRIAVKSSGKTVDMDGASVVLNLILPDGVSTTADGSIEAGACIVTLPPLCYQRGETRGVLLMQFGTQAAIPVYAFVLRCFEDLTDAFADPDHVIPSLAEILAQLDAAKAAAKAAQDGASAANSAADAASTAAGSATAAASDANTAAVAASKAAQAADAAAARLDGLTATATGLAEGSDPTVSVTTGEDGARVLAFGIPKGDKGDTGETGPQGPKGDTGDIGALTINGKKPDGSGAVTLTANDLGAATAEEVSQLKNDKLDKTATAADASKLGGVAARDYALKTDTAPDSSKLGGKAPEYYLQPRNLLDNSDFTNPVNQRGQTDYTSNGYTIDRWELYSGAVSVSSLGYITTSGQMYQKIAIPTDKVYTFAIENDAGIALVTGIPANGIHSATLGNALIKLATIGEYVEVVIEPSEGHNIAGAYWAALYEGTYTADTLPPYVPKGYAAELAECQRYFRKGVQAVTMGTQYNNSGSIFSLSVPGMRINPTTTLTDILSQGWGNVAASNYTAGWIDNFGSSFYVNYISSVSDDVGKNVAVVYEISADL